MSKKSTAEKWWLPLLVAVLPAIIAGVFGWQAKDKADKTADQLAVSYQLMKQALEVVQHESDGYRESLQHTNDLLVKLLEEKQAPTAGEAQVLAEARKLNQKLEAPPDRPHLPTNVFDIVNSKK